MSKRDEGRYAILGILLFAAILSLALLSGCRRINRPEACPYEELKEYYLTDAGASNYSNCPVMTCDVDRATLSGIPLGAPMFQLRKLKEAGFVWGEGGLYRDGIGIGFSRDSNHFAAIAWDCRFSEPILPLELKKGPQQLLLTADITLPQLSNYLGEAFTSAGSHLRGISLWYEFRDREMVAYFDDEHVPQYHKNYDPNYMLLQSFIIRCGCVRLKPDPPGAWIDEPTLTNLPVLECRSAIKGD